MTTVDRWAVWRKAPTGQGQDVWVGWFRRLAEQVLLQGRLRAGTRRLRPVEVEFYYQGPGHHDPFAHAHPSQRSCGRWYFHRSPSRRPDAGFRGGSFKGLDLTFGPAGAAGGILLRTLRDEADGALINGCSLVVDRLLRDCGIDTVAALDRVLDGHIEAKGVLRWEWAPVAEPRPIHATPRVGLTLKRAAEHPTMPAFIDRPYRFLTEPAVPKGRAETVRGLLAAGRGIDEVARLSRARRSTVARLAASLSAQAGSTPA